MLGSRGNISSSSVALFNGGMAVHRLTGLIKHASKVEVVWTGNKPTPERVVRKRSGIQLNPKTLTHEEDRGGKADR